MEHPRWQKLYLHGSFKNSLRIYVRVNCCMFTSIIISVKQHHNSLAYLLIYIYILYLLRIENQIKIPAFQIIWSFNGIKNIKFAAPNWLSWPNPNESRCPSRSKSISLVIPTAEPPYKTNSSVIAAAIDWLDLIDWLALMDSNALGFPNLSCCCWFFRIVKLFNEMRQWHRIWLVLFSHKKCILVKW